MLQCSLVPQNHTHFDEIKESIFIYLLCSQTTVANHESFSGRQRLMVQQRGWSEVPQLTRFSYAPWWVHADYILSTESSPQILCSTGSTRGETQIITRKLSWCLNLESLIQQKGGMVKARQIACALIYLFDLKCQRAAFSQWHLLNK